MRVRAGQAGGAHQLERLQAPRFGQFLRVALADFGHVGALFASSRWVVRAVTRRIDEGARVVVEYGPGDGTLSRGILARLREGGRLIGIEVNDSFCRLLRAAQDLRLEVVAGDALGVSERLRALAPQGVDAVVSGIPLSFLTPRDRDRLFFHTSHALRPGGSFIVYQCTPQLWFSRAARRHFRAVERRFEVRNLPPCFITILTK
jgi:phospholipid N-methyltransferase